MRCICEYVDTVTGINWEGQAREGGYSPTLSKTAAAAHKVAKAIATPRTQRGKLFADVAGTLEGERGEGRKVQGECRGDNETGPATSRTDDCCCYCSLSFFRSGPCLR